MKVIIIDDEQAMHLIMKRMLSKIEDVTVVGSFLETKTAFMYLANNRVDMIFIDINMPMESGLEFAERLREDGNQIKIVFVTSHTEYSLPAFDVYAFDYIMKPVKNERLQRTIQRAQFLMGNEAGSVEQVSSISVRFHCLGGMEIRTTENALVKWKTSKSAELFGYLLVHKGRLVSRSRIIEDMFGEFSLKNSETYLNTTVYQLRKLLDNYGLKGSLYSDNNHYGLDVDRMNIDSISFEEGCKHVFLENDTQIDEAIKLEQLYTGSLFGDRAFPWAWGEVERLEVVYTSLVHRLCEALLIRGDIQPAIRLLTKISARNELEEETIKLQMRALALQNNLEALNRQYAQFTETLQRELGLSPSDEVTSLFRDLKSGINR